VRCSPRYAEGVKGGIAVCVLAVLLASCSAGDSPAELAQIESPDPTGTATSIPTPAPPVTGGCSSRTLPGIVTIERDLLISAGSLAIGAGTFEATSDGFGLQHPRCVSDTLFAYGDIVRSRDHPQLGRTALSTEGAFGRKIVRHQSS